MLIGQLSRDVIGCKARVQFVSNWSVSIRLLLVKLHSLSVFVHGDYCSFDTPNKQGSKSTNDSPLA